MKVWELIVYCLLIIAGMMIVATALSSCSHPQRPQRFRPALVVRDAFNCPPGWTCLRNQDADRLGFYLRDLEDYARSCR